MANVFPITYMPELMLQKVLEMGIYDLQQNPDKMDQIFNIYRTEEFTLYGDSFVQKIKDWIVSVDIPVVQSWSFNPERIPSISVHLASEVEDVDKAAVNDFFGKNPSSPTEDVGVSVFLVTLDIGIHTSKDSNYVLWLYYIIHYILFTYKLFMEKMGFQLQTFSGGDYIKDPQYVSNNIWSRWVRFTCVVQNCWTTLKESEYEIILRSYIDSSAEGDQPVLMFERKLEE